MFIDFTNDDVVLYMLSENKHLENPNNPNAVEVNNSIHQMNNNNITYYYIIFLYINILILLYFKLRFYLIK